MWWPDVSPTPSQSVSEMYDSWNWGFNTASSGLGWWWYDGATDGQWLMRTYTYQDVNNCGTRAWHLLDVAADVDVNVNATVYD